jgi:hypothetical protein
VGILIATLTVALAACAPGATKAHSGGAIVAATATTPNTITVVAPAAWKTRTSAPLYAENLAFVTPTIGYLCTQDSQGSSSNKPVLFKTIDGGQTWANVTTPNPGLPCDVIADPNDVNDLFLQQVLTQTTGAGDPLQAALWRSRDGGVSWSPASLLPHTYGWLKIIVQRSRLYALAEPAFYGAGGCGPGTPAPSAMSTPGSEVYLTLRLS